VCETSGCQRRNSHSRKNFKVKRSNSVNFFRFHALTCTIPQSQKSKSIELKFGAKERERGQVLHAKFGHDRQVDIKAPNFIKFAVLASIFCCQTQFCTDSAGIWHEAVHYRHSHMPNMSLIGDREASVQISTFGQIWSFSVFFYHPWAGQTCTKLM